MKTILASLQQKRIRLCGMLVACTVTTGLLSAQSPAPRIAAEITNSEMSAIKGSQHPLAQPQNDAGRMPGNTRLTGISLRFSRSAAQQADLEALMAAQQNPSSASYHQWLTPDQFAARFGMAQSDLEKVQSWLEQQGFSIDSVARSRNMIRFSGTASQVESAFSTQMHYYNVGGQKHFAPSTALSVPAAIASTVESIRDLNDFKPKAMHIVAPVANTRPSFTSSQSGAVYFSPGDIKTIYDMTSVLATYDGTGQSITVVGQSSVQLSDIESFQAAAGFTKKDPTVILVPGTGDPEAYSGDQGESDLDLEWSGATAPGADIFFVYTGNSTNNGVFDSITYAVDERIGNIISASYGTCEPEVGTTLESVFQQATVQGQSIFAASGDQGSTACNNPLDTSIPVATQQELAVSYPASSPYVTGVGGTEIDQSNAAYYTQGQGYWEAQNTSADEVSSALKYIPEVAWNDDANSNLLGVSPQNGGGLSATGGGASSLFTTKPSWQVNVPGIPADGKRDVPDVALFSSPFYVAYLMCTSDTSFWQSSQQASCNSGFRDSSTQDLTGVGGTSVATPIFAGMIAVINQQAKYVSGQGMVNPMLYTLASNSSTYGTAFHDITKGNNFCTAGTNYSYCSSSGATEGFQAGTGYDQVTGLGSVDFANLAGAWKANSSTSASLIASTTTVAASATAPTSGQSVTFTITVAPVTGTGTPTGTVNLSIDGSGTSYGTGSVTPVTLSSNGTATYTTSFTTTGTHEVVAEYGGDATFATSAGAASVTIGTTSSGKGTIALAATGVTVAQGSSGSSTITVTPAGGYTGTVLLTFDTSNDTALTNLCYQFSNTLSSGDGSVTVGGTAAVTTQLTLDTSASCVNSTAAKPGMRSFRVLRSGKSVSQSPAPKPAPNRLPAAAAFAGLVLAGFLGRYARKLRSAAWIIALAAAGLGLSACGSGGSSSTTVPDPPKGTYTITVTGQDSVTASIKATTTFSFTIN